MARSSACATASPSTAAPTTPSVSASRYNTASHLVGPYRVPAVDVEGAVYFTNKAHFAPYRGAGRPEAVFAMDRLLDAAAHELGLDPADLRRRNLVTAAEMPYDTGIMAAATARRRSTTAATTRPASRRRWTSSTTTPCAASSRRSGRAASTAASASPPTSRAPAAARSRARVGGLDADGHVWVYTGACSQGQGHETAFAQVCAEQLGVAVDQVTVVPGDTAGIARGQGTRASRSAVVAGAAIGQASQRWAQRLRDASRDPPLQKKKWTKP